MALFRVDFSGRGELADRQQKLGQMLSRLQKISEGSTAAFVFCLTYRKMPKCLSQQTLNSVNLRETYDKFFEVCGGNVYASPCVVSWSV